MERAVGAERAISARLSLEHEVNRLMWDERAPAHAASPEYGLDRFASDPNHVSDVVRFDLPRLGDISGLRGVHLQCHIGTDTVSLSRLGAPDVRAGLLGRRDHRGHATWRPARAPTSTSTSPMSTTPSRSSGAGGYDLVFTGIGALGWLPDIDRWGQVVADLLRPGGRLFLREGHPVLWSLADPRPDGLVVVEYPYFTPAEPTVWDEEGTYVTTEVELRPHRLARVEPRPGRGVSCAARRRDGRHRAWSSTTAVPWNARPGEMVETDGEWRMRDRPGALPLHLHPAGPQAVTADAD